MLALFAPLVATPDQLATLRGDSLAALFNVANWRYILEGSSYGELFTAPSPLLHFWSLAIEEQFYLVFPVLLWAIVRIGGARRVVVGGALAALAAGVTGMGRRLVGLSVDRIYFGTDTRASELLLGGVLAVVLTDAACAAGLAAHRPGEDRRARPGRRGPGGAAVVVVGPRPVHGLALPGRVHRVRRAHLPGHPCRGDPGGAGASPRLSVAPLRWLGARSYAIYLVHWPLFLAARQTWGDADRWVLTAGVVAASLLLAELSFRVLERPIRIRVRLPEPRRALAALGASAAAVVVLAFTVVPDDPEGTGPDFDAGPRGVPGAPRRGVGRPVGHRRPARSRGAPTHLRRCPRWPCTATRPRWPWGWGWPPGATRPAGWTSSWATSASAAG